MEDYEVRLWVEYKELESRISRLENMLDNWETLLFEPECSYIQLNKQLITMKMYLNALNQRNDVRRLLGIAQKGMEQEERVCTNHTVFHLNMDSIHEELYKIFDEEIRTMYTVYVRLDSDGINEAKPLRNYKTYIEAFNWIKKEGRTNG